MERLRPYFLKCRGLARVDDRRVLSGIIFIHRNFSRWGDIGRFARSMMGLTEHGPDKRTISIDATYPLPGNRCLQR